MKRALGRRLEGWTLIEQTAGGRRGRWYDTSVLAREKVTSIDVLEKSQQRAAYA